MTPQLKLASKLQCSNLQQTLFPHRAGPMSWEVVSIMRQVGGARSVSDAESCAARQKVNSCCQSISKVSPATVSVSNLARF